MQPGQYFSGSIQTQEEHDAENQKLVDAFNECYAAADGDVPAQSISAKLDYSQITTHNSNGSYGIKIWVVEK